MDANYEELLTDVVNHRNALEFARSVRETAERDLEAAVARVTVARETLNIAEARMRETSTALAMYYHANPVPVPIQLPPPDCEEILAPGRDRDREVEPIDG